MQNGKFNHFKHQLPIDVFPGRYGTTIDYVIFWILKTFQTALFRSKLYDN